jgi:integrase
MRKTGYKKLSVGVWLTPDGRYWIRAERRTHGVTVSLERFAKAATLDAAQAARAALAREASAQLIAKVSPPTPPAPPPQRTTFADYVMQWTVTKSKRVRPGTIDRYIDMLGRRILPVLGEVAIAEITRADVERWVIWAEEQTSRADRRYSTATLETWWRLLGLVLRDAAADHRIPDPTLRVSPPRSPRRNVRQRDTLTPRQLGRLLDTIERVWPGWHAEVFTLAFSGMRPSELYALQWDDIDERRLVISIRRSVVRGVVSATKTDAPREAGLHRSLRDALEVHRLRMAEAGRRVSGAGLIFPAADGGHRGTAALGKLLRLAGGAAGLPVAVGALMLRRTFNTLVALAGTDRLVLRAQLGHTTEKMTERYAGVPATAKVEAVGVLMEAVNQARIVGTGTGTSVGVDAKADPRNDKSP